MLYVTSRNKVDTYTAFRVLREEPKPEDGVIAPFRMQAMPAQQIQRLYEGSFFDAMAQILNHFFGTRLVGWDLELCVGRNVYTVQELTLRLSLAQVWHNPGNDYRYLEAVLYKQLCPEGGSAPTWVRTVIRAAVLAGLLTRSDPEECTDIAGCSTDSTTFLAPFLLRQLGLNVGKILIGCTEDSGLWELFHKGQLPGGAGSAKDLELLIYLLFGAEQAHRFWDACEKRRTFHLDPLQQEILTDGFFASVVGEARVNGITANLPQTVRCEISGKAAAAYAAVQDYRAKTGICRNVWILSDRNPDVYPE